MNAVTKVIKHIRMCQFADRCSLYTVDNVICNKYGGSYYAFNKYAGCYRKMKHEELKRGNINEDKR